MLEYGNFVDVPYCARLMADPGAEVIKIEEPVSGSESVPRQAFA